MAVFNGVWGPRNAGQNRQRLTAQTDQSPSSVGSGTSSVSLRLRVWYESAFSVSWNGVGVSVSGGWSHSGSVNISHGGSGGRTLIYDSTITVPTAYASTVKRSFTATTSGITLFSPSSASVSGTHTVQARPVSAPNAASGVSASRVSDSRQDVSWSASATSARPIDSQTVQRRETNSAGTWQSWKNVSGTLSGGARSWADTGAVANRQYQYRVVTRNAAGNTTSGGSSSVRTTPAAPTIGSAVKQADGSIRVGYSVNARYSDHLEHVLQDNPGGTGWVTVATQSGSGALVHDSPNPAVTHQYRVATRSTYSNPGPLTSAYSSASNTVQLLAAPNPPTVLGPSGVVDMDAEPVFFEWQHNPVDSSDQTRAEIRARWVGETSWTTTVINRAEQRYRRVPAYGEARKREFQVRTRGAHPDWSPWSALQVVTFAAAPTVAINIPSGGSLEQSRVDLLIGYAHPDDSPQARVQAELVLDGDVIETLTWAGTADTGVFRTALVDGQTYTVRARAQAGNGLWSAWDETSFVADFPAPVGYAVEGEWDKGTGAVSLSSALTDGEVSVYKWEGVRLASPSTKTMEETEVTNVVHNPRGLPDTSPFLPTIEALHAYSMNLDTNQVTFNKDGETPSNSASTTKTLTAYVTLQYVEDLDATVVVDPADERPGESRADLQGGDVISYRDLLYGLMIPSGNDAAHTLARNVGPLIDPNTTDPAATFVAEMSARGVNDFGWGAHTTGSASGGWMVSAKDVCSMLVGVWQREPWLVNEVMPLDDYDLTITGPNARTQRVTHTMKTYRPYLPGVISGKTGTGDTWSTLTILWEAPDGSTHVSALQRASSNWHRYAGMREIIAGTSGDNRVLVGTFPIPDATFADPQLTNDRLGYSDGLWSVDGSTLVAAGGEGEGQFRFYPRSGTGLERGFRVFPDVNVQFSFEYRWRGTGGSGDRVRVLWAWGNENGTSFSSNGWEAIARGGDTPEGEWTTFTSSRDRGGHYCYPILEVYDGELAPGTWLEIRNFGVSGPGVVIDQIDPDLRFGFAGEGSTLTGVFGPKPAGWGQRPGAPAYYSKSRDAVGVHISSVESWGSAAHAVYTKPAPGAGTAVTEVVDSTAEALLVSSFEGAGQSTSNGEIVPAGGGFIRWFRSDVGSGDVFVPLRFPTLQAAEAVVGETFYVRTLVTTGEEEYEGAVFDGDHQSTLAAETLTYQRRDTTDSSWVTLAEQVDPGTSITDPTPVLGAPEYRVISHTSLPSSQTGPVTVVPWVHGRDPIFVNTGPDYSVVGKAIGRHANDAYAIEQETFPAAGFDFPLAMVGDGETGTTSFTGTIVAPFITDDGVTTRAGWRDILRHRQVVCYRDCQGRKLYGLLSLAFAQDGPVETVTITVDEVWHREGIAS